MVEKIALREAIDSLPERERITILLRFFRGMTQEQAARILKVSQVQVSRLERKGLASSGNFRSVTGFRSIWEVFNDIAAASSF